jgi:HK97 family phage prohead protease
MKYLNVPLALESKAFGDSGSFEGYAAIFGNVDLGGDVIERGAFKEIITGRNGMVKILNQHRSSDPIGVAEVKQDDKGLQFKGQLILEAASARSAYALMKGGALDGMSIGYDVMEGGGKILESGIRQLTALKLWEISPVTFGMNPLAGIDSVKTAAQITTIREFEDFLRDAGGFSKAQAVAIASGGWKTLQDRRDSGDESVKNYLEMLNNFATSPHGVPQ